MKVLPGYLVDNPGSSARTPPLPGFLPELPLSTGSSYHLDLIGRKKMLKQCIRKATIKIIIDSYLNQCKCYKCFDIIDC